MGLNPSTLWTHTAPNTVSPMSANSTQNSTNPSPLKLRLRNSRSWISGCSWRSSISAKTTSRMSPTARQPMVFAEPQPQVWLSIRPSTASVSPGTIVASPSQSMRAPSSGVDRGTVMWATRSITAPMGTLIQNTARQLTSCVSTPPTSGPSARKIIETPA